MDTDTIRCNRYQPKRKVGMTSACVAKEEEEMQTEPRTTNPTDTVTPTQNSNFMVSSQGPMLQEDSQTLNGSTNSTATSIPRSDRQPLTYGRDEGSNSSFDESTRPLFPGHAFISTVLEVLDNKATMTGKLTGRYIQRAAMAGIFVSLFIAVFFVVQGAASIGEDPGLRFAGKIVAGIVFGWALVLIYYTNSELLTSNMMVVSIGTYHRRINLLQTLKMLGLCLFGNLLGALVVALILRCSTILSGPAFDLMLTAANTKTGYLNSPMGVLDLFARAIFCNFCINIAMLMVFNGKLSNDFTKCTIMVVAVLVFTFCGFEHSVADSAIFLILGTYGSVNAWRAILVVIVAMLGNLVGGGVLIGYNFATMNDESSMTGKKIND